MATPKGYEYHTHGATWLHTTETSWPRGSVQEMADINWRLRYGTPTKQDLVIAATVMTAYAAIIDKPRDVREAVIRALRHADQLDEQKAKGGADGGTRARARR